MSLKRVLNLNSGHPLHRSALTRFALATYWPSVMMGLSDRWGTVSAGKLADIVAVQGDVLRYIHLLQRVDLVMKGGVVYKQEGRPVESVLSAKSR